MYQRYYINKLKYLKMINHNLVGGNKQKEIYILRHGESEANKENIIQGNEYDTDLTALGREQAKKTGKYLKKYRIKNNNFDAIYSSPLKRTAKTAQIISDIIGFNEDIIYDDRLVERSKGRLSGMPKTNPEIKKLYAKFDRLYIANEDPIENYNAHYRNKIYHKVSKKYNINGESNLESEKRAENFLEDIIASNHSKILIVSHNGFLSGMIRVMINTTYAPFINKGNCWLAYLTYGNTDNISKHRFRLESPPNRHHLEIV